jgi:hypothetical protein
MRGAQLNMQSSVDTLHLVSVLDHHLCAVLDLFRFDVDGLAIACLKNTHSRIDGFQVNLAVQKVNYFD